jgi:hypothetical protein
VAIDGRVTLVLDPTAREVQTHWVLLAVRSLEEAVEELATREKIPFDMRSRWVGRLVERDPMCDPGNTDPAIRNTIAAWLERQPLDGVVWTALPSRGPDGEETRPDFDRLLGHLKSLDGEARDRAEEYIRRTPDSIETTYRKRFEEFLGRVPAVMKKVEGD